VEAAREGGESGLVVSELVRAAGGVAWRQNDAKIEVLLVHRPQYDDWTFPKGKNTPGESDEDAAVREVEEETGLHCRLGAELPSTSYVANGEPKIVRYWIVEPEDPEAARPQHEIDELAWLSPSDAAGRLTYERDLDVLRAFLEAVG
jgi:8-oxo-dGTP pyrophosphatase MutT (NUDIX family)